jgi:hypothetical protein
MLLEHMFVFIVQKNQIFFISFAISFEFFIETGARELGSRKNTSKKITFVHFYQANLR